MAGESNMGMNKLARVMQERMTRSQSASALLPLDFGTIKSDMSLLTNTFAIPIPQADYHVCRQLTLGRQGDRFTSATTDSGHGHDILIPDKMRSIRPGDRVLVAWVQSEPVIIDIVLRGTSI